MTNLHALGSKKGETPKEVKVHDRKARSEIDGDLTDRAIKYMKRSVRNDKPFFACMPYTQVNLPTIPHPDFEDATGNGRWANVLTEVDSRAGQLLDAIDDFGIRDNTVFIWMSEYGTEEICPHHGTSERSAREGFPMYNGEIFQAYKWRNWKLHFKTQETMRSVICPRATLRRG